MKSTSEMCLGAGLWTSERTQFSRESLFCQTVMVPAPCSSCFVHSTIEKFSNLTKEIFLSSKEAVLWKLSMWVDSLLSNLEGQISAQSEPPAFSSPPTWATPIVATTMNSPSFSSPVPPTGSPALWTFLYLKSLRGEVSLGLCFKAMHKAWCMLGKSICIKSYLSRTRLDPVAAAKIIWFKIILTEIHPYGSLREVDKGYGKRENSGLCLHSASYLGQKPQPPWTLVSPSPSPSLCTTFSVIFTFYLWGRAFYCWLIVFLAKQLVYFWVLFCLSHCSTVDTCCCVGFSHCF